MGTIVYGFGHIKSSQGILKFIEFVSSFIGLLLVVSYGWTSPLNNALMVGFIVVIIMSFTLLLLHITAIGKSIQGLLAYQLYYNIIWFIYLLIVSAVVLSRSVGWARYLAAGSFGIITSIAYIADTVDCYRIDPSPIFCLRR